MEVTNLRNQVSGIRIRPDSLCMSRWEIETDVCKYIWTTSWAWAHLGRKSWPTVSLHLASPSLTCHSDNSWESSLHGWCSQITVQLTISGSRTCHKISFNRSPDAQRLQHCWQPAWFRQNMCNKYVPCSWVEHLLWRVTILYLYTWWKFLLFIAYRLWRNEMVIAFETCLLHVNFKFLWFVCWNPENTCLQISDFGNRTRAARFFSQVGNH